MAPVLRQYYCFYTRVYLHLYLGEQLSRGAYPGLGQGRGQMQARWSSDLGQLLNAGRASANPPHPVEPEKAHLGCQQIVPVGSLLGVESVGA
jgi:hypothetical protein